MTSVDFKCKCPCCKCRGNGPIKQWKCPDCGSKKLFTDEAKIICSGCGKRTHYIWRAMFKCGNGDEDYHYISYQGLLTTLSAMGSIENPPYNFLQKVSMICFQNASKFSQQ